MEQKILTKKPRDSLVRYDQPVEVLISPDANGG